MPSFEFRGKDANGKPVQGTFQSGSIAEAAMALTSQGLTVEHLGATEGHVPPQRDITSERHVVSTHVVGPIVGKVSLAQLCFFFRQLGTMVAAGVPAVTSLETLAGQSSDFRLRRIVKEMAQHVREGRPYTAAMQRYPEVFTPLMVSMVRAGEESGLVDRQFSLLANYIQQEIELRNLVRRLTAYPKIVVVASIVIVTAANAIIAMIGRGAGLQSPLTNPVTWVVLTPIIIGGFLFFRIGLQTIAIKKWWDMFILMIPFVGKTVHQLAMAKFGRAFAALYKGGVPIPKAVVLAADACGSEYLRQRMIPAADRLQEGYGLSDTFAETGAFSKIVLDMTRTGETTGNLDEMLDRLSQFYEDDAAVRATQMAHIVGVLCLLFVAAYVGYVVITFFMGHYAGLSDAAQDGLRE